ncbi:uncharacterized protein LOC101846970 [Aplysia californica]|uniref:Uncharacterized protein LOC101846970 n=1 Tax=Aplysia californica TaxID=6500 RepID=A0ABM0JTG3_APLCA|nr:uncharacterized protein LOC101846970 [Aplysia californica]
MKKVTGGYSDFQIKARELDLLKTEVLNHLGKLNAVKLHYMDWFDRRRQTFVDSVKLMQITLPQIVPQETSSIGNFRKAYDVARKLPKRGFPVERCAEIMGEYFDFWNRLLELHREGIEVYNKVCKYCSGVTRMREPHINDTVDDLQKRLNMSIQEDFNFMSVHNERDNLFTYRVAQHDHRFHGLLAYIPYLLKMATTICFWCNKMFLEKE